jgi:hypothetical protein
MIEGYQSVRPLSAAEIEALPILCRGSALRFFLTRLYDWLTTPAGALVVKKDPLEYLKKLRFLARTALSRNECSKSSGLRLTIRSRLPQGNRRFADRKVLAERKEWLYSG